MAVAYFYVLSRNLHEGAEENSEAVQDSIGSSGDSYGHLRNTKSGRNSNDKTGRNGRSRVECLRKTSSISKQISGLWAKI